jgi:hypothetical protein
LGVSAVKLVFTRGIRISRVEWITTITPTTGKTTTGITIIISRITTIRIPTTITPTTAITSTTICVLLIIAIVVN